MELVRLHELELTPVNEVPQKEVSVSYEKNTEMVP